MSVVLCLVILMTTFSLARAQCTVSSYPELCLAMADAAYYPGAKVDLTLVY